MEEGALTRVVESKDDWRVALMTKVTEWTQSNETLLLPVIAQSETSVLELLDEVKVDDLPHFYIFNPTASRAAAYPDKLDLKENYSPELIIAWANAQKLTFELEALTNSKARLDARLEKLEKED